ncbi:MAG: quinolinate synthase NadA [Candidatus Gastranaerophilales bacterium]|nr:quinolinate synthase NadA [Candidatus Gastranaerophilales bacterium]
MNLVEKINKLKKEKNAIILTHCYQNIEIDEVSDFVGDSLYLSRAAAKTNADIIIFAGVYFMAQSAKLLSPSKRVFLPNMNSGCLMADMIDVNNLRQFKSQNPDIPVVCYINSTAEVKAECDICCTSSNAIEVVRSLNVNKVLFAPDTYLGKWVEYKLKNVEVITFNGFCPTHLRIRVEDIENARRRYPDYLILAHPECHSEVSKLADFVGSTKEITEFAQKSSHTKFIIATEKGVVDRLNRDSMKNNQGKTFVLINDNIVCPNMKCNTLEDILYTLENENNEIFIDTNTAEKAKRSIEKMLLLSERK